MSWEDQVYLGTDLDTNFKSIDDLFMDIDYGEPWQPDMTFSPFSGYWAAEDGSRLGVGFPHGTLKWAGLPQDMTEILYSIFDGKLSIPLYIRTYTNRRDDNNEPIFRTYLTQAFYPIEEDDQGTGKVGFVIEWAHGVLQAEEYP